MSPKRRKIPRVGLPETDDRGVTRGMDAALKAKGARSGKPDEADAPPVRHVPDDTGSARGSALVAGDALTRPGTAARGVNGLPPDSAA